MRVPTTVVGDMWLSRLQIGHTTQTYGHLITRNDQQPTCQKFPREVSPMEEHQYKSNKKR